MYKNVIGNVQSKQAPETKINKKQILIFQSNA